jgi:23S rRNA pseudouridine1911/1915/1917 synthase
LGREARLLEHELEIPEELAGRRLDQALAALLPDYSRSRLKAWILAGRVSLDGAAVSPRTPVATGQCVKLQAEAETRADDAPQPIALDVVYADEHLAVINKPAGLVVHPGAGQPRDTLVNGLLHRWPELHALPRGGLLHRLDKDTTGLLVVARSEAAYTRLVQDLQERLISREYRAVCVGRLTAGGRVEQPVGRHPVHRTRMTVTPKGRPSVTHSRVLARFPAHTFLALRLETGRTHQIRVHMAHSGHPLVGDALYGGRQRYPAEASAVCRAAIDGFRRQALHASHLRFTHPVSGAPVECVAPLPADLLALLGALAEKADAPIDFNGLQWPNSS